MRSLLALLLLASVPLAACGGGAHKPIAPPPGPPPAANAVWTHFEADDDEPWSLRRADGSSVCDLPCARWVAPKSELYVQRVGEASPSYRAYVPSDTAHEGGSTVRARVLPKRGGEVGPALMYTFSFVPLGLIVAGAVCLGADCGISQAASVGGIALGTAYIVGAVYWFAWSRSSTQLTWTLESRPAPPSGWSFHNGTLTAAMGRSRDASRDASRGITVSIGPGFLAGTF
jgi:hypothetical protein